MALSAEARDNAQASALCPVATITSSETQRHHELNASCSKAVCLSSKGTHQQSSCQALQSHHCLKAYAYERLQLVNGNILFNHTMLKCLKTLRGFPNCLRVFKYSRVVSNIVSISPSVSAQRVIRLLLYLCKSLKPFELVDQELEWHQNQVCATRLSEVCKVLFEGLAFRKARK